MGPNSWDPSIDASLSGWVDGIVGQTNPLTDPHLRVGHGSSHLLWHWVLHRIDVMVSYVAWRFCIIIFLQFSILVGNFYEIRYDFRKQHLRAVIYYNKVWQEKITKKWEYHCSSLILVKLTATRILCPLIQILWVCRILLIPTSLPLHFLKRQLVFPPIIPQSIGSGPSYAGG